MNEPALPFVTVGEALRCARAGGLDRLDAQLLLAHVLARPRTWLLAHEDAALDPRQIRALTMGLARRAAGEPLAYLVGSKAFHGIELQVNSDVLVPRPDTEVLVDWALELLVRAPDAGGAPRVVDLGTGSGAIALAVKQGRPGAEMLATDVSEVALVVARRNALRLGIAISLSAGDWWSALEGRRLHLALSNPPYIDSADPHLEALHFEPRLALTPGADGLAALREIAIGARRHLEPGGWLLLEHGHTQARAVRAMLREQGGCRIETRRDLGSRERCTGAQF